MMYEFKCISCDEEFDTYVNYADIESVKCPLCDGDTEKLISSPNLSAPGTFGLTGKVHPKLGGEPIKGVKDFEDRCEAQGFYPQTKKDIQDLE